ncbi:MAG: lysophospholipid acyltransferase family protein [Opitutaceae bacterium]|jgi:KDO2-lipid IV(A) lauroyltransferase|nr:lysophospholipid acyltransferase family protein [Opitutaceae bacterium]
MSSASVQPANESSGVGREPIRPTPVRRLKWRLELVAYVIFEALLGLMPLPWVAKIGRGLGVLAHACLGERRRIVRRNLRIALAGERTPAELRELTVEVFRRSGANLLCSLRTAEMSERSLARAVVLRDEIVFREAVAKGKGVVMVLAHMGNWEALAQWFPKLLPPGVAGATVYRPLNNPIMNARVVETRARRGIGLFSKDDNPLGMAGFLRRGGVLGVLSDQRAGKIGEQVPFFGRLTSCTPIPAILARRTGAAVVGVSLRTVGAGRWEMGFHAMEAGEPTTPRVMALLERMMRESMADVFWLQDRWRVSRRHPQWDAGKPVRGEAPAPRKRRRALLWAQASGGWAEPRPANPDDVDYERVERRPGEGAEAFLRRVDEAAELPLDYVVGGAEERGLKKACRKLGIGWSGGAVK